jgi:hypothetical protein
MGVLSWYMNLGIRVKGLGFAMQGTGCRVQGARCRLRRLYDLRANIGIGVGRGDQRKGGGVGKVCYLRVVSTKENTKARGATAVVGRVY